MECGLPCGNDQFLDVAALLSLEDNAKMMIVNKAWLFLVDGAEILWRSHCERVWASKHYVPHSLLSLAKNEAAPCQDLMDLDTGELLELLRPTCHGLEVWERIRQLKIQEEESNSIDTAQKLELVDAIIKDLTTPKSRLHIDTLLNRPAMLLHEGELPPKGALRLSLADAKRTAITEAELSSLRFCVRLRQDGRLAQATHLDPWWQGKGHGQATFGKDREMQLITFEWPKDPATGERIDPFAAMGIPVEMAQLSWSMEMGGQVVRIRFNGRNGPQEIVCRHPDSWGWVLYSQSTLWTSWTMPTRDKQDPLLQDDALVRLPSDIARDF